MATLKELLEDEEQKETIQAELNDWAKQNGFRAPDEVEGLVKKKDELLQKVSKLNRETTSEEQRQILETITELGIESADDIKQLVEGKGKSKAGDEEIQRKLNRLQKEAEQNKTAYETERKQRLNYAKENAITKALKNAGVKDSAFDMAYAYFDRVAQVEENDGQVAVIAQDSEGLGPPIDKFIAEWAKSDPAKDYIQQPVNRGAGITGAPSGDAKGKTLSVTEFGNLGPKDQAQFFKDGGQLKDE